jgi:hypothetical protein
MKTNAQSTFRKTAIAAATAALALGIGTASADIAIFAGPTSAGDTDNVIFANCIGNNLGPANTITGCLNSNREQLVGFTSNDLITGTESGGQARIEGANATTTFDDLMIYLDPLATSSFTKISFNINTDSLDPTGTVTITAVGSETVSETFAVGGGANFFYAIATNDQFIQYIQFESNVGINSVLFDDVRQVRIGGPTISLPEPGALALFGVVLGALGATSRRRTNS